MTHFDHFSIDDMQRSNMAHERGIENSIPPELMESALLTLAMMERIRAKLCSLAGRDIPISPSSGYRCPELNWAVRRPKAGPGRDASGDHPKAAAMDWCAPRFGTPRQVCEALAPYVSELGIGQLIYEGIWVHTSRLPQANPVNRIITKVADGYAVGIVEA